MFQLIEKPHNQAAWDRFVEIGLPGRGSENYQYVRLKELYSLSFHAPTFLHPTDLVREEGTLVFIDGSYCEALSSPPKPFIALPLSQAYKVYGGFLHARLHKQLYEEKDPFALLNNAYFFEGLFLYLPPKSVCTSLLKIINIATSTDKPVLICPRIHLCVGKEASATLSFHQRNLQNLFSNTFIDIALEEQAHISFVSISDQQEKAHDFLSIRATLKSGSQFKSFSISNGGTTSRHDYNICLQGENSEALLYGLWSLAHSRQHHINILMDHREASCQSLQKFKGIVKEASRSSFEGKIYVHQKAQKTQAYQMNNNLILGDRASAHSKPNLEIFADDVKASHGATVGQLDNEQLFYLTARGLAKELAHTLLLRGFSQEVLDLIENDYLREEASMVIA